MRIPSLHISRTDLEGFILKYGPISTDNLNQFMKFSRSVAVSHRSLHTTTKKNSEKATKLVSSNVGDANMVAEIIYALRVKLKHLGVTKVRQTDHTWVHMKELATVLNEFCSTYDLPAREGYINFISIGMKLIAKASKPNYTFCAKWMVQRASDIVAVIEGEQQINQDTNKEVTQELHDIYVREVAERTGIYNRYEKDPTKMMDFMRAKDLIEELNVEPNVFIQAQFYALEFCNGIPRTSDIFGDKAKERLIKYVGEKNLTLEPADNKVKIDWKNFKK